MRSAVWCRWGKNGRRPDGEDAMRGVLEGRGAISSWATVVAGAGQRDWRPIADGWWLDAGHTKKPAFV